MKLRHNHRANPAPSVEVDEEYQAQVDRSTDRLVRKYRKAQGRLEKARSSLGRAKTEKSRVNIQRDIDDRLFELREIEALMRSSPQSSSHRGTASFRPVPPPGRNI